MWTTAKPVTVKNSGRSMRQIYLFIRRQRNILTDRELQSSPLSKHCGKNMPDCWNRNGKPMLPTNRYGLICGNCKMSRRMWTIFWIFLPGGKHSQTYRSHDNHRLFSFVFQRSQNAQPSPQVAISGVWGYVTNKHYCRFSGNGKSAIIRNLTEDCIACRFVKEPTMWEYRISCY